MIFERVKFWLYATFIWPFVQPKNLSSDTDPDDLIPATIEEMDKILEEHTAKEKG